MLALAIATFAWQQALLSTPEDGPLVLQLVTRLLEDVVRKTDYFAPVEAKKSAAPRGAPRAPEPSPSPELALKHLRACLDTGNETVAGAIIEKLCNFTGVAEGVAEKRATHVLIPLIPQVEAIATARPLDSPIPNLQDLYRITVQRALAGMKVRTPTKADFDSVLRAVIACRDERLIQTS